MLVKTDAQLVQPSTCTSRRSTTGCASCKIRRKKCDEAKPRCSRCLDARSPCSYEYVEYLESEGYRVKRTKPAPRSTRGVLANAPQNALTSPDGVSPASSFIPPDSDDPAMFDRPILLDHQTLGDKVLRHSSLGVPKDAASSMLIRSSPAWLLPDSSSLTLSGSVRISTRVQHRYDVISPASSSTSRAIIDLDLEGGNQAGSDPEGIQELIYMVPIMDKNVKENTLPFVLQCYSQWVVAVVFEPLNVVHKMRDQVIAQFSSESTRARAILIANVMGVFAKNFAIDDARKSILDHLALDVQKGGAAFMISPPSPVPALDRQNAIRILDNMMETVTLLLSTCPTSSFIQLLESAAPIFRRACVEPLDQPVNLPNILLDLSLNLRYFATIDILKNIATGLPTCFQYKVPFSLELCDRIYYLQRQGNYGLQWCFGIPDQFIVLFAWINTMFETAEAGDHSGLVGWIEEILPQIKVATDDSGEPALRLVRMMVLESWRLAVQIYLYMALGKANAHDPRVVRTQKAFMRLIQSTRPGRHPDLYLGVQIGVIGVATTKERHREVLRRRMLGVREREEQGTAPNGILLTLEDIWARTRDEGRAAVWSDRRIAYSRLTSR